MPNQAYRENYKLIDWSKEIVVERKERLPVTRSDLPAPMIVGDTIEPTRSMADGRIYTSKAMLRATYKPSGNPHGNSYTEVGNEKLKPKEKPKSDRKAISDSVERAFAKVGLGA
jgi:hypothetical protein